MFTRSPRNFIGILGIAIMILASLIFQPYDRNADQNSNQRYSISISLWILGLIITGIWFSKVETISRKKVAMTFGVIGQVLLWFLIREIIPSLVYDTAIVSSLIPPIIVCWLLGLVVVKVRRIGRYKNVVRRNFSSYTQSEILDKQKNS